jgi:small subunit ribosomal protein S16
MQYWLTQGAQPTDRVAKFLASAELIAKPAQKSNPIQGKPKAKAQERIRALQAAEEAAAAAAAKAAEQPAEAPAEASE